MGEKFQLEAQLAANKEQLRSMKKKYNDHVEEHHKTKFETEKKVKEMQRSRLDLENEVRNITNATNKANDDFFTNNMYLTKDKAREEKRQIRHVEDMELLKKLK